MKGRNWNPATLPAPLSLHEVQANHPTLGQWGWPPKVHEAPINPEQFDLACAFIAAFGRRLQCFNNRRTSYGLKHTAESWAGADISNGSFTAAALAFGFRHKIDGGSPNSLFDMELLKRERRVGEMLATDDDHHLLASMLALVHAWADELRVPFRSLWDAIDPAVLEHSGDAFAFGQHLDSALKRGPGDSLAAFGRIFQKAAR